VSTNDILTIEDIDARYQDEWVLIGNPEVDEAGRVIRGEVLHHSPDRDEIYREAQRTERTHIATHFAGELPHDMVRIL
jgi:hypothetical protein